MATLDKFKIANLPARTQMSTNDNLVIERSTDDAAYKIDYVSLARAVLSNFTLSVGRTTTSSGSITTLSADFVNGTSRTNISKVELRDGILQSASYNSTTKKLTLTFNTQDRSSNIEIDLSDLDETAGAGLALGTDGRKLAVDLASNTGLGFSTTGDTGKLQLNLTLGGGLQVASNAVGVKLNSSGGLASDANGIKVNVGTGLKIASNTVQVNNTEIWTFTLPNGTTTNKTVVLA